MCATRDKKIKMSNYSRMVFVIYCKNEELMSLLPFDKREFTIDELFTLCSNGEIVIIDNMVIPENMSNIEIERAITEKRLILNPANINCINKDCKIHADYIECKNDFDKKIWYLIYNNFISYLRLEVITANKEVKNDELTNLNVLFNEIVNHLTEIITGIEIKYNKKKIPTEIQNIIIEIKQLLTQAQEEFDKDTQISSEIIDIPLQKKANTQ